MTNESDHPHWPMSADQRRQTVDAVVSIATEPGDPREQLAAARCLLRMEAANAKDDHDPSDLRRAIERTLRQRNAD